jgi:hypothetical protein
VLALTLLGPGLVALWSAGTLHASHASAFAFSLYGTVFILSNTFSVLMFAHNYTRGILPIAVLGPPIFVLFVWLTRSVGMTAVVVGNTLVTALGLAVGIAFYLRLAKPAEAVEASDSGTARSRALE